MTGASEPTVFIVDDDAGMRKSTSLLLGAAGLRHRAFESAVAFLQEYVVGEPGCLILDMSMPQMSGLDLIQKLRADGTLIPILVVSGTSTISTAVQGMKLGVVDFLEKPVQPQVLIDKVRHALSLDAQRRAEAADLRSVTERFSAMTPRERELLKLLAQGRSNKQIAADLHISPKTVDNHRTRLMRKTGALNAADLVRLAVTAGLV